MSIFVAARGVAVCCLLALVLLCRPAAAMPVADSDLAQLRIDIAPDVANIRIPVVTINPDVPNVRIPVVTINPDVPNIRIPVVTINPPAAIAATPPQRAEPFGLPAMKLIAGPVVAKWNGVAAAIRAERDILARCRAAAATCPAAAKQFLAIVESGHQRIGRARFGDINRAINLSIRYMSDQAQYGVEDRWSSPLATLAAGAGDCEDYAIAKYVALLAAGVADGDVRLVIVRDTILQSDHAVVAARLDGRWVILDNRRLLLLADTELRGVVPLFVLDSDGVKRFVPTAIPVAAIRPATPVADGAAPTLASARM